MLPAGVDIAKLGSMKELLARENCAFYASEYLRGPAEYNGKFFTGAHHEDWADLANAHKKLCVLAARDHGKSFFWTFAYPLWMADRNPGQRSGFIFSASQAQADEIMVRIMREVESNPKMRHLLPGNTGHEKGKNQRWSTKTLEFSNGFTLHARGYGTKVRGGHPIFIVLDDILNDETAFSETTRNKEIEYFHSAVSNMLVPGGQLIVVGTPFHRNDLYGELEINSPKNSYVIKKYPAIRPDGNALWPERYPLAALEKKRDAIGPLRFAREFMASAVSDLSSLFPRELFMGDPVEQFTAQLGAPGSWWRQHGINHTFMGVDIAISAEMGADYTVIFTLGVDVQGNHWVLDIQREHGLSFGAQKSMINTIAQKYRPDLIYVESNAAQKVWGDELIRLTDLPVKHFATSGTKHSLSDGLPSLKVLLENRKVRIPRGTTKSVEITDVWIDEMRAFTFSSGRVFSVGQHDDTAMAFWLAEQAIKDGKFTFTFGEEEGDAEAFEEFINLTMTEEEAQDDEWNDYIPGAIARVGRMKKLNAQVVDENTIDEGIDNPRNPHGNPQHRGGGDMRSPKPEVEKDWRPKLGSPKASAFIGGGWSR